MQAATGSATDLSFQKATSTLRPEEEWELATRKEGRECPQQLERLQRAGHVQIENEDSLKVGTLKTS